MTAVPGPVGTEGGLREDETVYRINAHVEAGTACSFCGASYYACTVAVLRPYNDPLRSDGCCDRCQDCAGHETRYLSQVGGLIAEAVAADRATGAAAVPAPAPESGLRVLSDAATPGVWRQNFYRDGELLPDGTGGMDDYETAGGGVYVIDEASEEGYCLIEFNAGRPQDAAFIVAAVNDVRTRFAAAVPAPAPESGLRAAVEAVLADGRSTFSIGGDLDLVVSVSDVRAALAATAPAPVGEGDEARVLARLLLDHERRHFGCRCNQWRATTNDSLRIARTQHATHVAEQIRAAGWHR